jgi:hypothetical protein
MTKGRVILSPMLEEFLRKERILTKFKSYALRRFNYTISMAFVWGETPEGRDYWYDIDTKFIDFLNDKAREKQRAED